MSDEEFYAIHDVVCPSGATVQSIPLVLQCSHMHNAHLVASIVAKSVSPKHNVTEHGRPVVLVFHCFSLVCHARL